MTIDFANKALRRGRAECDQRLERVIFQLSGQLKLLRNFSLSE
jgi:hypothetical protein